MKTIKSDERIELLTKYRNNNLFIEAGAGAGKTQFISNKTTDLILQGVSVDKIILITFTNKAAEEMLTRISKDINKKITEAKDQDIKNKLIEARDNLYRLNVSTIHSFCNKLLNENSFLAKIPYNFTLIDEDEEEERRNEYYSKWISTLSKEDFNNINKLAFFPNPLYEIKNKYIKLCEYFPDQDINIDVPTDEEYYSFLSSINDLYKLLTSHQANLSIFFNKSAIAFIKEYEELLNEITTFNIEDISIYLSDRIIVEKIENVIQKFKLKIGLNIIHQDNSSSIIKEGEDLTKELEKYQTIKEQARRMSTYKYRYINRYAKEAFDFYNDNCSKDKLSNNQLIYYTYKLLADKSNNKVREALAKKYNSIFVDEFQDTDKYQIKFIDELVKAIQYRKDIEKVDNTTLIVVGDPKQSIYRFRGADINSFLNYRDDDSFKKEKIFLPDNFRSNNFIIDYLNDTFKKKDFHPNYKYDDMIVASNNIVNPTNLLDKDNPLAGVYSYQFNVDKEEISEDNNKFINLVKLVKYLVDNNYKIYKCVDDKYGFYNIEYNDFLVLTHSKSEINEYVKLFNKFDIKVEVAGEYNLTSSTLFNLIYCIYAYILDKSDNNYLLVKSHFDNEESLNNYLNDLTNKVINMTPYGKLMYIFNTLGNEKFYIKGFINSDIDTYNTVIHQVLEYININVQGDAIHILNELNKLRETPVEQQLSLSNDNKCLRIMNMHKSKGLEGNIVIVPDSGSSKDDVSSLLIDNTYYLSFANSLDSVKTRGEAEINEERIRLEYVVASRAKSVLIFEEEYSSKSKIFSKEDYDFSNNNLIKYQLSNSSLPDEQDINNYFKDYLIMDDQIYEISSNKQYKLDNLNKIITPSINSFSPSLKENHDETIIKSDKLINRPRNNIFGDCLHKGMELLINDYSLDIDLIASSVINEHQLDILDNEIDKYKKYLIKCIKAIKSIYDESNINKYDKYPEFKFSTYLLEENALVNGSMDLFLINKDNKEIKIIDYKSDIANFIDNESFKELLINRYKPQLEFYRKVANNLYPNYKIDLSIIYIEEDNDNEIAHEITLNNN